MEYKYNAIILSKRDILEVDRLYTLYTREAGKITVLGKGVRKASAKLAGSLEPVTSGEVFIARGKGRGKITGVIAVNIFPGIKTNVELIERVFFVFSIVDRLLVSEERDEDVFWLLNSYLETMEKLSAKDKPENKIDILTQAFLIKLLDRLGYKLQVDRCVIGGERLVEGNVFFSAEKGGVICQHCSRSNYRQLKIPSGAVKLVRLFLTNKIENMIKIGAEKKDIDSVKIIAQEMIRWIT